MAGLDCQCYGTENYPEDTPLGTVVRLFPEINWGWQGGPFPEGSEENSMCACLP